MVRALLRSVVWAAALVSVLVVPCRSFAEPGHGEKAIRILDEMIRVLDRILSRRSSAALQPSAVEWTSLFDGRSLGKWVRTEFAGGGEVRVEADFQGAPAIVIEPGATLSGITYTGAPPKEPYEVSLDFMKVEGSDFACGLTFPVGDSHATLVLGGWGGGTVGISSIDGMDASENETTTWIEFTPGRWYAVRMRVTATRLEAWLDDKQIVNVDIAGRASACGMARYRGRGPSGSHRFKQGPRTAAFASGGYRASTRSTT